MRQQRRQCCLGLYQQTVRSVGCLGAGHDATQHTLDAIAHKGLPLYSINELGEGSDMGASKIRAVVRVDNCNREGRHHDSVCELLLFR